MIHSRWPQLRRRRCASILAGVGLLAGLSLDLAGCTLGPDFVKPVGSAPSAYSADALPLLEAGSPQRLDPQGRDTTAWWARFGSAQLDATMQAALSGNRTLAAAQAHLEQSVEVANASAGGLYPQLSLGAGAGRQQYGAAFLGKQKVPAFTYFSIGPSVSFALDYLGGTQRAVEQQQALAEYQRHQVGAAILSLTGNVAMQALTVASTRAQIDAVGTLLTEDEKNLSLVQTTFDAGSGTRVDVLAAQSQLANDQTLLPPLHQQLARARHALAILIGHPPADWNAPEFSLSDLELPQALPLSLPSELAHRRPDILAAEAQLHAATAAVGVATANLYPQLRISGSASQQSTELSQLFDPASTAWSFADALTAPLFDGGTLRAQRRGAEDALHAAAANYQQTVLEAFGQVADLLTALEHDAEMMDAQQHALDAATASLELTRESYRAGNVGVLQVLDAERLYQQAQLGYVRAQAQRYLDTAQLFVALGGSEPAPV